MVGGGFAGLSAAYHLTRQSALGVVILEQEAALGGHASGRNAGMIRQALSDPHLVCLAKEGREALRDVAVRGWKKIRFQANGSLLLARAGAVKELQKVHEILRGQRIASRWMSRRAAGTHVSVLRAADFEKALFCPSDATVDIRGLLSEFVRGLRSRGVRVLCGHRILAIRKKNGGFQVRTAKNIFYAQKVVNAAGAWAGPVGRKAGATAIPFSAYRRHLFFADAVPGFRRDWPFVWDLSQDVYFRPQGRQLMLSPCDKVLFKLEEHKSRNYGVDPAMQKVLLRKLARFSKGFGPIRIRSKVAGLRTMVPDGRFVIGEDPRLKGFYWVAGLGGHGVTTAFSVGRMASDMILGKKVDPKLKKVFSPARFS